MDLVQALISLDKNTNRVLNVIKAKYGLNDKGQAIEFLVEKYIDEAEDRELRPEFVKELERISKQKSIKVDDFAKEFNL